MEHKINISLEGFVGDPKEIRAQLQELDRKIKSESSVLSRLQKLSVKKGLSWEEERRFNEADERLQEYTAQRSVLLMKLSVSMKAISRTPSTQSLSDAKKSANDGDKQQDQSNENTNRSNP